MRTNQKTKKLVTLGLLTAVLLLLSCTPLGYLKLGIIEITLNVIPLAVAAVALGAEGGAVIGAVFGLTSFLQCIGIGGSSAFGAALFNINPIFTFVLCLVPRVLDGAVSGYAFTVMGKKMNKTLACAITGFLAAFVNTLLFVGGVILLFGNSEYIQQMRNGADIITFICAFVGINAVFEMLASTVITSAVGKAMVKMNILHIA